MLEAEFENYVAWLSRLPLSGHTRRNYAGRLKKYLQWLAGCPDSERALHEVGERDYSVREFKQYLLQNGCSATTVNTTLASLDNFYLFKGLGAAKVTRQEIGKLAPRALTPQDQRRFAKVVATTPSTRDRAIASLLLHCGLRLSELHDLNVGDVVLTARKREVTVRCGKGAKRRTVPLNVDVAEALQTYLGSRISADPGAPLFISQKANRLSTSAIDRVIRAFGKEAQVELSSHTLRHTFVTRLIRANQDLVVVASLAGHGINMTQRYSLPSVDDMILAVERARDYAATT